MCREILNRLTNEDAPHIVTSVYTLVEVISYKRPKETKITLPNSEQEKIEALFNQRKIDKINCTRKIAEIGRGLCWKYSINAADAIHLSTATALRIPVFNTFDDKLLSINKVGTTAIQRPSVEGVQLTLLDSLN